VSPFSTQVIKPFQPTFTKINKSVLIDSFTVTLTGDNNSTIDMTGGTGLLSDMQKFSITLVIQDIKD